MSQEFQAMEQCINRTNIYYNLACTVLGALLGLALPAIVSNVPHWLALIGH